MLSQTDDNSLVENQVKWNTVDIKLDVQASLKILFKMLYVFIDFTAKSKWTLCYWPLFNHGSLLIHDFRQNLILRLTHSVEWVLLGSSDPHVKVINWIWPSPDSVQKQFHKIKSETKPISKLINHKPLPAYWSLFRSISPQLKPFTMCECGEVKLGLTLHSRLFHSYDGPDGVVLFCIKQLKNAIINIKWVKFLS